MATSATARRCSSVAWAAILARASSARHPAQPHQAVEPRRDVAKTTTTFWYRRDIRFSTMQRHIVDHHRAPAARPRSARRSAPGPAVHDPSRRRAGGVVAEDPARPSRPGRGRRRRSSTSGAECRHDRGQAGRAGLHDLAGEPVRVDDHRAERGQPLGHGALAGADAAGQPTISSHHHIIAHILPAQRARGRSGPAVRRRRKGDLPACGRESRILGDVRPGEDFPGANVTGRT